MKVVGENKSLSFKDVSRHRLLNQQILTKKFSTPSGILQWLGAIQAQDYSMAKWAVGVRLTNSAEHQVEQAINNGDIIRTHVLRPTWHLAHKDDVRWMLRLTAPRIITAAASMFRSLELTDEVFNRSNRIIEKSLAGNKHLTRQELMTELGRSGIITNDLRASHLMLKAELDGVVCNGQRRGKELTYALFDERVPNTIDFKKDEALAELAQRYFASHGPATIKDFIWWSSLSATDAKAGLETIKSGLISEKIGNEIYWFSNSMTQEKTYKRSIQFLPAFDEFMVSYKDRSASVNPTYFKHAFTGNGIFKPIIVVKGKVIGAWKRTFKKDRILIETEIFDATVKVTKEKLAAASSIKDYGRFLGLKIELI